jgi:hypothetical protein
MEKKRPLPKKPARRLNPAYKGERILPKPPAEGSFKDAPPWAIELYGEIKLMEYSIISTNTAVEHILNILLPSDRSKGPSMKKETSEQGGI